MSYIEDMTERGSNRINPTQKVGLVRGLRSQKPVAAEIVQVTDIGPLRKHTIQITDTAKADVFEDDNANYYRHIRADQYEKIPGSAITAVHNRAHKRGNIFVNGKESNLDFPVPSNLEKKPTKLEIFSKVRDKQIDIAEAGDRILAGDPGFDTQEAITQLLRKKKKIRGYIRNAKKRRSPISYLRIRMGEEE